MILDWYRFCEKLHRTKTLLLKDPSDAKASIRQEVYYMKYLTSELKYTQLQCYGEWCKIKNGRAKVFNDDPDQLAIEFLAIFRAAINRTKKIHAPLEPINVYQEEVEWLNEQDVPIWIKEFWLIELIYYKFAHQLFETIEFTSTIASWCMRQVKHLGPNNRGFHKNREIIGKANVKTGAIKFIHTSRFSHNTFIPTFLRSEGEVALTISEIEKAKTALVLLDTNHAHCEVCGKTFEKNSRSQTHLCPNCYKKERRTYIKEKVKKYRNLKKLEKIKKN